MDIWELQTRTTKESEWRFDGKILALALIDFVSDYNDDDDIRSVADEWPGWYHYQSDYLIRLDYPGRFEYCMSCKHTAQEVEGPSRRHTTDTCVKLVCGIYGHTGHDNERPGGTGYSRKICDDRRNLRRKVEPEEARKRQKTCLDKTSQGDTAESSPTIMPEDTSSQV